MEHPARPTDCEKMITLTPILARDTLHPIFFEVGDMKGSCKEYKPGRWRIRVWTNGDRYEFVRTKHGDILEGPKQAHKAWAQITQEIEDKIFNPED